jgi:hypothetical protein
VGDLDFDRSTLLVTFVPEIVTSATAFLLAESITSFLSYQILVKRTNF